MKKQTICIILTMMLSTVAAAQVDATFQFIDADGNIVPDGSTVTVSAISEWGQMDIPLRVSNVSDSPAAVSIYENIDAKPCGLWQTCIFGNCRVLNSSGYSSKGIADEGYSEGILTEWIPDEGYYGVWECTLQIHVFNIVSQFQSGTTTNVPGNEVIGYGPTVKVQFVCQDPATVNSTSHTPSASTDYYSLGGIKAPSPYSGLCIMRRPDGSTVKTVRKYSYR